MRWTLRHAMALTVPRQALSAIDSVVVLTLDRR